MKITFFCSVYSNFCSDLLCVYLSPFHYSFYSHCSLLPLFVFLLLFFEFLFIYCFHYLNGNSIDGIPVFLFPCVHKEKEHLLKRESKKKGCGCYKTCLLKLERWNSKSKSIYKYDIKHVYK